MTNLPNYKDFLTEAQMANQGEFITLVGGKGRDFIPYSSSSSSMDGITTYSVYNTAGKGTLPQSIMDKVGIDPGSYYIFVQETADYINQKILADNPVVRIVIPDYYTDFTMDVAKALKQVTALPVYAGTDGIEVDDLNADSGILVLSAYLTTGAQIGQLYSSLKGLGATNIIGCTIFKK